MLFYYSDTQRLKAMSGERNTTVGGSSFDSKRRFFPSAAFPPKALDATRSALSQKP